MPPTEEVSGMKALHPPPWRLRLEGAALLVVAVWAVIVPLLPFLITLVGALLSIAAVPMVLRDVLRRRAH
jgi:hypothetical protein